MQQPHRARTRQSSTARGARARRLRAAADGGGASIAVALKKPDNSPITLTMQALAERLRGNAGPASPTPQKLDHDPRRTTDHPKAASAERCREPRRHAAQCDTRRRTRLRALGPASSGRLPPGPAGTRPRSREHFVRSAPCDAAVSAALRLPDHLVAVTVCAFAATQPAAQTPPPTGTTPPKPPFQHAGILLARSCSLPARAARRVQARFSVPSIAATPGVPAGEPLAQSDAPSVAAAPPPDSRPARHAPPGRTERKLRRWRRGTTARSQVVNCIRDATRIYGGSSRKPRLREVRVRPDPYAYKAAVRERRPVPVHAYDLVENACAHARERRSRSTCEAAGLRRRVEVLPRRLREWTGAGC